MADEVKKSIVEWEREKNAIITADINLEKKVTEQEFLDITYDGTKHVGVDHAQRIEWLEANGYEATRENMIDTTLAGKLPTNNE